MASLPPAARRARALPDASAGLGVQRAVGRASRTLIVACALLAMGTVDTLQVLQSSRVATLGYDLRTLEAERTDLSAQVAQLESQVATRSNLEHVHQEAVERLGMTAPTERVTVSVDVTAPRVVPLPRRFVAPIRPIELVEPGWLERLLGSLRGFN